MISTTTIENVRELTIVEVVQKYYPDIKKMGNTYRGNSPWSEERTPSFYVVPNKNIFKDFSTGRGGDGIKFLMELQGKSYIDTIKTLCADFNIKIEYEDNGRTKEENDSLELLYKVNQATARRYAQEILNIDHTHPAYHNLINQRRFTADTILQWEIGFAPVHGEKWNFLSHILIGSGHYQQGIDLTLIKTKNETTYDTFRNRIMFPIIDHHGRYVGFGGRAIAPDDHNQKYLNSTNSKIFNKSRTLYGLYFASQAIRKQGYANLMEGYTDVISFHQAGQNNTIGTCGTALTEDQAKLLRKYTQNVVLINDPDEAGQNATSRTIDVLMQFGFQCSVLPMPSIIKLKPEKPWIEPWQQPGFITHRTKEELHFKTVDEVLNLKFNDITEIEKVDPDALVRMF